MGKVSNRPSIAAILLATFAYASCHAAGSASTSLNQLIQKGVSDGRLEVAGIVLGQDDIQRLENYSSPLPGGFFADDVFTCKRLGDNDNEILVVAESSPLGAGAPGSIARVTVASNINVFSRPQSCPRQVARIDGEWSPLIPLGKPASDLWGSLGLGPDAVEGLSRIVAGDFYEYDSQATVLSKLTMRAFLISLDVPGGARSITLIVGEDSAGTVVLVSYSLLATN